MSPSFLVPLTSASGSWTSSRKRWLPFTIQLLASANTFFPACPMPPHDGHYQLIPRIFKTALVTLILKKPGLDPDDLHSYRPISNLPFLSKILERAVAAQLQQHMSNHELCKPLQSGFRACHSMETALIKITNNLLITADSGHISILILLDLSAAFDTISHTILLTHLSDYLGLTGIALSWFQYYLTKLTVVASKALLQKVGELLLDVDGFFISPFMEVHNLGVILDSTLSF